MFAVYDVTDGGMTLVETGTAAQGAGSTAYQIQTPLEFGARVQWRVRAFLDGAFGPWSALASFTTRPPFDPPTPTFPINGQTLTNFRPVFNVINGSVEDDAGEVIYQIQVALDGGFSNIVAEEGTELRNQGDTNIHLQKDREPLTQYFWQVRGRNDGQGKTGLVPGVATVASRVGGWSPTQDFFTPEEVRNAPGKGACCPPPNRGDIVIAVLIATGNLVRDDVQQFTERVAECLAVTDGDWGRRRNSSGTVGKDTIAYDLAGAPFSIDILSGAVGPNPIPQWIEHGQIGGSWFAVDGSNCVLGAVTLR